VSSHAIANSFSKDFPGATVTFKKGLEISSVKLPSDCSSIQLVDLPTDAKPHAVVEILAGFGFIVLESAIQIKPMGRSGSLATIRFNDLQSARLVVQKFEKAFGSNRGELSIKAILIPSKFGNRLSLNSVTCSWRRPSKMARLWYDNFDEAYAAKNALERHPNILGRKFEIIGPDLDNCAARLDVTGLDPTTEERHFNEILTLVHRPQTITLKKPPCILSDEESREVVETLLRDVGTMESFWLRETAADSKWIRATVTFIDQDSAIQAVKKLHNTRVPKFGSRLFVSRIISVKYYVSNKIVDAIQTRLDQISRIAREVDKTQLKIYTNEDRPFTTIRISGENAKPVADIKVIVERLIDGNVLMNGESALWNVWFSTRDALDYFSELSKEKNVYIYRDARKCQLRLFGCSAASQSAIERILITRVESNNKDMPTTKPELSILFKVIFGGIQKLRGKLNNPDTLNRSENSRSTSVYSSTKDLETTRAPLMSDCSICWCPATEPIQPSCGHTYCRDCFHGAAESAVDNLPFHCFGQKGECDHIFTIQELRDILPFAKFEKLLRDSFDAHIRTHPEALQHCPTPDCPSVYRPTEDGTAFTCHTCLTTICTTCNVRWHEGMACAEWKEFHADVGMEALRRYKEEHDVRDCPKCKAGIEKDAGCMHMQCENCKVHICWFCMQVFEVREEDGLAECYAHMTETHGSIYDPLDRNYLDMDDDDDFRDLD
jgi:hypothetical protein